MVATDAVNRDQGRYFPDFTPGDLTPAAFPHAIVRLEVRETHISWVVLTGPFAYKIKKSVRFDFLDASTLERRHDLCEEELRLNRRLAGDIYVDVVPITRDAGALHVGGQGPIVDYAVRMKQFDAAEELPALLARAAVRGDEFIDLAVRLADFHRQAPSAPVSRDFPHTQQLYDAVLGNLATAPGRTSIHRLWCRKWGRSSTGRTIICTPRSMPCAPASSTGPSANVTATCTHATSFGGRVDWSRSTVWNSIRSFAGSM